MNPEETLSNNNNSPQYISTPTRDSNDKQLINVLTQHQDSLNELRRELRGEQLYQNEKTGQVKWVQVDKPMFVMQDKNNQPIRVKNEETGRMDFIVNDEAIGNVIQILKSSGMNSIAPLTALNENEIIADLREIESKIAVLLFAKRKKWGIDKAEYPILVSNLKVMIKDARYRAKDGIVLKAIRTMTTRMEQTTENHGKNTKGAIERPSRSVFR